MVAAFPLAKLGTLLLRQASKPIATYAKEKAKKSQFFRTYICMPPAQFYNWCEVKMKMWVMNLGKPINIPQLNETMAIELGANLLGESIIFTIAAAVLFMEYSRQTRKETAKEEARKAEMNSLNFTIQELYFQAEKQDTQIRELTRTIMDLESRVVHKPWKPSSSPPPDDPHPPLSSAATSPPPVGNKTSNNPGGNPHSGVIVSAIHYVTNDVMQHNFAGR